MGVIGAALHGGSGGSALWRCKQTLFVLQVFKSCSAGC